MPGFLAETAAVRESTWRVAPIPSDLRDRRVELMSSKIKVTELYLTNLHKRLAGLEREAGPFKPYSDNPDAPPLPEDLAAELAHTTATIDIYERTLERARADQERVVETFELDIMRFRQLKGG